MEDDDTAVEQARRSRAQPRHLRREIGMDVLGHELAVETPGAEALAPGERLRGDGVGRRRRGEHLVNRPHAARRSTAAARRVLTAGQPYRSST